MSDLKAGRQEVRIEQKIAKIITLLRTNKKV